MLCGVFLLPFSTVAQPMSTKLWGGLQPQDIEYLQELSAAMVDKDHQKAVKVTQKMQESKSAFSDSALNIALWKKYGKNSSKSDFKDINFSDISRFVNDNQFFPNLPLLQKNTQKIAKKQSVPYLLSKKYFSNFPAKGLEAKIYLLESEAKQLETFSGNEQLVEQMQNLLVDIWVNENFSADKELDFLEKYSKKLTEEDHAAKITRLLWDGKEEEARRNFYLLSDGYRKLFLATIRISKNPKYIKHIISSVPRSFRGSEILAYKVIKWHKNNNKKLSKIVDMLQDVPATVKRPEKWWPLRKLYARELLKTKYYRFFKGRDYKKSYKLLANHGLKGGANFADAEWTAGWVALRFLDKPKIAYDHFYNLYLNVSYPISISRGAYWLAEAALAMGDKKKALEWYEIAAKYPTYFYGQIAIHKRRSLDIHSHDDIILPKDPDILKDDIKAVKNEMSIKVAYLLYLLGEKSNATKAFEYAIAHAKTEGQIAAIMKIVNEMKNRELSVKISKAAAKRNVFFIADKYQMIDKFKHKPSAALVHAIIKQESGFAKLALSSAGAVGFMQLMPETAKDVSRELGLKYSRKKLAHDVDYNITLGSYYIDNLTADFSGSEILAIAAYNAGPHNAKRWVEEFYDPRKTQDINKVVDWIELITYSETRNYVQRIMENLVVYKYLMAKSTHKESFKQSLKIK